MRQPITPQAVQQIYTAIPGRKKKAGEKQRKCDKQRIFD
jgi:hypothetical protein